ncbi:MAG: type 1 glutamine amidotransferase domain-containing protein [Flavobacteriaceae bacterium]|nr:type 1 glutamine amidotransferase domain-containing protein [Flavobacteriaceae bacterium]
MTLKILIPIPDKDFDLTEVAVPWKRFTENGYQVVFATEKGLIGKTDQRLIDGVIFGQLGAKPYAIAIYNEMLQSDEFNHPITYDAINPDDYALLHLPGGHEKGIKQYLESAVLQEKVAQFFYRNKWVGSVCHGAIVLARTIDKNTGKSIVADRKLTALTKSLEKLAYYITAWKLGDYYRTYPTYTQDEVQSCLIDKSHFKTGAFMFKPFVCNDKNLITARWPKDIELYCQTLLKSLKSVKN